MPHAGDGCEIRLHHVRNYAEQKQVCWYLQGGSHQKAELLRWCRICSIHSMAAYKKPNFESFSGGRVLLLSQRIWRETLDANV